MRVRWLRLEGDDGRRSQTSAWSIWAVYKESLGREPGCRGQVRRSHIHCVISYFLIFKEKFKSKMLNKSVLPIQGLHFKSSHRRWLV